MENNISIQKNWNPKNIPTIYILAFNKNIFKTNLISGGNYFRYLDSHLKFGGACRN